MDDPIQQSVNPSDGEGSACGVNMLLQIQFDGYIILKAAKKVVKQAFRIIDRWQ